MIYGKFMNTTNEQLLRPGQVAEQLNVSLQTLWRWRQEGTGPAFIKLGDGRNSTVRYLPLKIAAPEPE